MKRIICLCLALCLLIASAAGETGFDAWLTAFNAYAEELGLREVTAEEFGDASEYLTEGSLMVLYDDCASVGVAPYGKGIEGFFVDGDPASDVTAKLIACTLCAADGSLDLAGVLSEAESIVSRADASGTVMGTLGDWMYLGYRDEDDIGVYVDVTFTLLPGSGAVLPPAMEETPEDEAPAGTEEPKTPAPVPHATPAPTDKPIHKA